MTYWEQALLSEDQDFRKRIAACVSTQDAIGNLLPLEWAEQHQWQISGAPGFADAYSYALNTGVEQPGRDAAVITDEDLLAAVQVEIQRWYG